MSTPTDRGESADGPPSEHAAMEHQVRGGGPLAGTLEVPGDKSISHRALLVASLAEGVSTVTGLSGGGDVDRTAAAMAAMGAGVRHDGAVVTVAGGRGALRAPAGEIDMGNSGTGMRLVAGLAATVPGTTRLTGDRSLRRRPMDRIAEPLGRMGARLEGYGNRCLPPLRVTGGRLHGIDYTPPMASAQVKSAILLAGLAAEGETVVREPVATRPHTEQMLAAAGAAVTVERMGRGRVVRVRRSRLHPGAIAVPGDPSQAAYWIVGAVVIPGSRVTVTGIHLGAERTGYLGVLRRMGADLEIDGQELELGTVTGSTSRLTGTVVEASEIPSLDEVPILAVAASQAAGVTRFRDVGELRVKESDRLAGTAAMIRTSGGVATVEADDLVVEGSDAPLRPGRVEARGDHRMAMAAAVAGAACPDPGSVTTVAGWECVSTSYPGFADDLARLRASGPERS